MLSNKTKIHGWINFDKPVGISSAKAVAVIRKKLNCSKSILLMKKQYQDKKKLFNLSK